MEPLRETAFFLMIWQTILAILATLLLVALNHIEPATALLIAANLALLYSLALMIRTARLDEQRIARGELWRTLPAQQRPPGEAGLRMARQVQEETWLRFAKGAAGIAIVLSALAYASHDIADATWAQAARQQGETVLMTGNALIGSAYGARLAPMN